MLTDTEVDMREEVNALARYDKQFNEAYRAFLDQKDDSYVMPDNEIVTIKGNIFSKLNFSLVTSTIFDFCRQKLDATFQSISNLKG